MHLIRKWNIGLAFVFECQFLYVGMAERNFVGSIVDTDVQAFLSFSMNSLPVGFSVVFHYGAALIFLNV